MTAGLNIRRNVVTTVAAFFINSFANGLPATLFLFFSVNMSMVMGLMPVVGVPLPLVSYGGTAMIILMMAFGLVQSAHVHRPR